MLKISACSESCNTCWKSVFKISVHVENCNACSKLCWIFQGVLKTCWKFQGMLKTIICVENYVETACWKFQPVLKTVMHIESYVKISRCVENVYVRHVENHIENCVEVQKKHHHTLRHVLKLSADFIFLIRFYTHNWSETYISYVSLRLRVQNRRTKWNFPLNFRTMRKLSELYSRIFQTQSSGCVSGLDHFRNFTNLKILNIKIVKYLLNCKRYLSYKFRIVQKSSECWVLENLDVHLERTTSELELKSEKSKIGTFCLELNGQVLVRQD